MEEKTNIVAFYDSIQRLIFAEYVSEDENFLEIKNPLTVNIVPQHNEKNQPVGHALQLIPIFFKEFVTDKTEPVVLTYPKTTIVMIKPFSNGWDFKLYMQYKNINEVYKNSPQPTKDEGDTKVIDLFKE